MGVISDSTVKQPTEYHHVEINAQAPDVICKGCGRTYVSRGLYDYGYCHECLESKGIHIIGGYAK